ncbi:hypothetical protein Xmar_13855 [Xanthomonas axonopodis pv. martyniicola]|nr:hypothetical protein Xmar_13855 [Xanthomonas axonopodis pv. martyniicola]
MNQQTACVIGGFLGYSGKIDGFFGIARIIMKALLIIAIDACRAFSLGAGQFCTAKLNLVAVLYTPAQRIADDGCIICACHREQVDLAITVMAADRLTNRIIGPCGISVAIFVDYSRKRTRAQGVVIDVSDVADLST